MFELENMVVVGNGFFPPVVDFLLMNKLTWNGEEAGAEEESLSVLLAFAGPANKREPR